MNEYFRKLSCFNSGQWFMFPIDFLRLMSEKESILLAYLINVAGMRIAAGHHDNHYFKMQTKPLTKKIGWSRAKTERIIKSLETGKWIKTEVRGHKRSRWILVDAHSLYKRLSNVSEPAHCNVTELTHLNVSVVTHPILLRSIKKNSKRKEHCRNCVATDWDSFSSRLEQSIRKIRTIPRNATLAHWPMQIRKVHTLDKVSPKRIEEVLTWYCKILGKEGDPNSSRKYTPVVWSGNAFRSKFTKLEDAMERRRAINQPATNPQKKKPEAEKYHDRFYSEGEDG